MLLVHQTASTGQTAGIVYRRDRTQSNNYSYKSKYHMVEHGGSKASMQIESLRLIWGGHERARCVEHTEVEHL